MRPLPLTLAGFLGTVVVLFLGVNVLYQERALEPEAKPGEMAPLASNASLNTINTTRVGSDDPVATAVAVAQIMYPATEEENVPGAVVLINRDELAEALVAASRVQHFPINAPLLYVEENSIPELTRAELLRLAPEGAFVDGNTQVYQVGTIGERVRRDVEAMGYRTRVLTAPDPIALSEVVDDWTSTIHGDHVNAIAVANLDRLEPAIPSAFFNAHKGDGLVFVTDEGVPEATRRMLERRASGPWLYLFGDETVISEETARELAHYGHVTRMPKADLPGMGAFFAGFKDQGQNWGGWWFENARAFGWGLSEAGHNAVFVTMDGAGGWRNVLPATTLSHMGKHAPVLVVERDGVPEAVANSLEILKPYPTAPQEQLLNHGWIIGGIERLSWETQAKLDLMLEAYTG